MKKNFCTMMLLCISLLAVAQTKKVAILETVDREGNISYANKLIVRANLAKAITNTPGYEAYDRTDMDAILGEQNFQRTGMVSDEQIKRLGEMTGAAYVLVAEVVQADQKTMYIIAKLLDVETGRIDATDNQLVGATAKEIQNGCVLLAKNLLKDKEVAQAVEPKEKVKQEPKKADNQLVKVTGTNEYAPDGGKIVYALTGTNTKLDKKAYEQFLQNNCPAAWRKYSSGKKAVVAGWSLFGIGMAAIGGGVALMCIGDDYYDYYYEDDDDIFILGVGILSAGAATFTAGIVTFSVGYGKKANAYKIYNESCAKDRQQLSLSLQASHNGLGLALNF